MVIVLAIFIILVQRQIKRPLPLFSFPGSTVEAPAEAPVPPSPPSAEKAEQPRSRRVPDEELRRQLGPGGSLVE